MAECLRQIPMIFVPLKNGRLKKIEQGFIIERLTNSILNTVSGDSFQTEVIRFGKSDMKHITKNKGWNFNWKEEFDEIKKEVYKLTIINNPRIIQGLLSVTIEQDHRNTGSANFS